MVTVTELKEAQLDLLKLDISMVGEDKDHLLFAVRIPKNVIAKNHRLLAVVSDRIGGYQAPPAPIREEIGIKKKRPIWTYAAMVLVGAALPWVLVSAVMADPPDTLSIFLQHNLSSYISYLF